MKVHICTRCQTPCYLIDMCKDNQAVPYTCPYGGEANWKQVNIDLGSIKEQLNSLAE